MRLRCYINRLLPYLTLTYMAHNKKHIKNATAKYLLAGVLSFGAIEISTPAMAQSAPQAPPTPPPPGELLNKAGEGLKKINPFKKHKKTEVDNHLNTTVDGGPPPPPNPLDLFKKKKKGSSSGPTPPPKPPGL
jgi:hypothetical protein